MTKLSSMTNLGVPLVMLLMSQTIGNAQMMARATPESRLNIPSTNRQIPARPVKGKVTDEKAMRCPV